MATFFEQRLRDTQLCLLGTLSASGWPRISPCEAYIVDADLMLGMMWQSNKALDLQRDPRLTVMTPQADRHAADGDLKLYGYALAVDDPERRRAHADAQEAIINWRPSDPYHLFAVDIRRAGYISFGEGRRLLRWSDEDGFVVLKHPED